ncbi:MAG: hypothetical protein GY927_19550, partial [bacterium]|nr:hypothetical protein [bacterium]
NMPDGQYTFAIRPHHVTPVRKDESAIAIEGVVEVAELSGSESIIHFDVFGQSWVSQSHGVHPYASGEPAKLYADVSQAFYFDGNERLANPEEMGTSNG